ncbi:inositol monophosphatase 1-like [Oppia nitens]|uniref:inositol monophosphatase 1-like n=1 Tax=Oppia nitens TaxID=1686743 RepID=UPI0023DB97CA|nr:inositol monophosphatase 1-like [Oppia nitens]XP_054162468.1 inositol monophosphatase 1-like [Oppia nitens]
MDSKELLRCQQIAVSLAIKVGQMMTNASGESRNISQKDSFADLVTETDKAVEKFLFDELKRHFPDFKFIGEESSSRVGLTSEPTWIIDPIDGTMNFVHTFPFTCVSIGLTVDKIAVLGVVFSPFLSKLYTAMKGCGAYCNGRPISVSKNCNSLKEALLVCEFGNQRDEEKRNAVFRNLESVGWLCHGIRCMGSAALNLCYVAEGFADAYWEFGLHVWDMAAAAVVLTEAGGVAVDTKGGPLDLTNRRIIGACNQSIADQLGNTLPIHLELERD